MKSIRDEIKKMIVDAVMAGRGTVDQHGAFHPLPDNAAISNHKPLWEKRYLHEKDYRDLTVELGFRTPPKEPDPEYGVLALAGPVMSWKGKPFWERWEKMGHTAIDPDQCVCCKGVH